MLKINDATPADAGTILMFIKALADYEKMSDQVVATNDDICTAIQQQQIFTKLAYWENVPVGFALCYKTFSTFTGKPGIHLEDLFVLPEYRGKGIGLALLRELAAGTVNQQYTRLEWNVLDWNKPSIEFYKSFGADHLTEWLSFRLDGDALLQLASKS